MKELALKYYEQGYNCGQCILKAAEEKYNFCICNQAIDSCSATNNGFGVGSMCSAIASAIMLLGILFPENVAKLLRMVFLSEISQKYPSLNCCKLSVLDNDCKELIGFIADSIGKIIDANKC